MQPYSERRTRLAKAIRSRGGGVAILTTGAELLRNADTDYPYRSDSYFYYMSGFTEPQAALAMVVGPKETESILFCRSKDKEREIWDGYRHGPKAAQRKFGFDTAHPIDELDQHMPRLLADQPAIFHCLASDGALDQRIQQWLAAVRNQKRAGVASPTSAVDIRALLDEMRLFKDAHELSVMRRAAQISAAAHARAMRVCAPGWFEYQIEAELLHEFKRNGSQFPAYTSIVASGPNACILHYRENNRRMQDGDLLLIDAGCELDGYASDITRTFPVNGRFSGPQRALYDVVLDAQQAAIKATRAGKRFIDPHNAALRVLVRGMIDHKLLKGSVEGVIESGAYRQFYMHRTGHWLGIDVHDCGEYREPGQARPKNPDAEKPWRVLRPGMVLTVEPGLYVRPAKGVPREFHNIGIRIEDDALVTTGAADILTHDIVKQADDIEALMRDAKRRAA